MQWKSFVYGFINGLFLKNLDLTCHIGLPEGTGVLSGVLAFLTVHELPIKDIPNIPASFTNALH